MIVFKNDRCPYCGETKFTELIHSDGFDFAATSKRCAKCNKVYIESQVFYNNNNLVGKLPEDIIQSLASLADEDNNQK